MTNWSTDSVKTDFTVGNKIKNLNTVKEDFAGEISTSNFGDDKVVGIDEPKLIATVNKLSLIDTKVTKLFEDLTESIEDTSYFSCSATGILNKVLNDISGNIPTIKNNATSYIDDLNLVIKGFGVIEYTNVAMLNKAGKRIPNIKSYKEKEN